MIEEMPQGCFLKRVGWAEKWLIASDKDARMIIGSLNRMRALSDGGLSLEALQWAAIDDLKKIQ